MEAKDREWSQVLCSTMARKDGHLANIFRFDNQEGTILFLLINFSPGGGIHVLFLQISSNFICIFGIIVLFSVSFLPSFQELCPRKQLLQGIFMLCQSRFREAFFSFQGYFSLVPTVWPFKPLLNNPDYSTRSITSRQIQFKYLLAVGESQQLFFFSICSFLIGLFFFLIIVFYLTITSD